MKTDSFEDNTVRSAFEAGADKVEQLEPAWEIPLTSSRNFQGSTTSFRQPRPVTPGNTGISRKHFLRLLSSLLAIGS